MPARVDTDTRPRPHHVPRWVGRKVGRKPPALSPCWTLGPLAHRDKEAACSQPGVSPAASLQGVGTGLWGWIRPPVEATGPWQPGLLRGVLGGRGTLSSPRAVPGGLTQSHPGRGTVPLSLLSPGPTAVQLREQTCSRRPRGAQGILEGAQRESRRPASEPKQGPAWSWGRGPGLEGSPSNQETSLGFE